MACSNTQRYKDNNRVPKKVVEKNTILEQKGTLIICKTFVCAGTDHRWVIRDESRTVILAGKQIESSTEYLIRLYPAGNKRCCRKMKARGMICDHFTATGTVKTKQKVTSLKFRQSTYLCERTFACSGKCAADAL